MASAALLVGCSKPAPAPKPQSITVVMDQMAFKPTTIEARVGDTLVWVNKDILQHSATASDASFDVDLPAGKTGSSVLTHAGTLKVTCKYHPGMTAQVHVNGGG
jgi:plastocyanin